METGDLVRLNLLSPMVLGFAAGAVVARLRGDLRLPDEAFRALSMYLLLAIGLKGGAQLADAPWGAVWRPLGATLALGVVTPLLAYGVARRWGRLDVSDAAALAAHYGSVSVVTFAASVAFVRAAGAPAEPFLAALVAIMEVPGIFVALALAHSRLGKRASWAAVSQEVLAGQSIALLVSGLAIGYAAGGAGMERVAPFFVAPFDGALTLFLLHLGTVAARRLADVRRAGVFLVGFGIVFPLVGGLAGVALGLAAGLSAGGAAVLGAMAGGASYIAAPAAVRLALPEADPGLSLAPALGITFPFNLVAGIPLYYALARAGHGLIAG